MNHGSPLSKDQRIQKPKEEEWKQEKPKISVATAKKILKPLKVEVGQFECRWVNRWVENEVQGKCLPKALFSNDFLAEVNKTFGAEADGFLCRLRTDFQATAPKTVPALEK
jgi:hypothetical protein